MATITSSVSQTHCKAVIEMTFTNEEELSVLKIIAFSLLLLLMFVLFRTRNRSSVCFVKKLFQSYEKLLNLAFLFVLTTGCALTSNMAIVTFIPFIFGFLLLITESESPNVCVCLSMRKTTTRMDGTSLEKKTHRSGKHRKSSVTDAA